MAIWSQLPVLYHRVANWSSTQACWSLFLIAVAVRLSYVIGMQTYMAVPNAELVKVARSLAERNEFADPFIIATGSTAHVAPIYPFLLSLIYRAAGTGTLGQFVTEIITSFISSAVWALLPLVSMALNMSLNVGLLAGLLGAVLPLRMWVETKGAWEAPLCALFLVLIVLFLAKLRTKDADFRAALSFGVLSSFALLTAPAILPSLIVLIGLTIMFQWRESRVPAKFWAVAITTILFVLTPWTLRNYYYFGGLVFIRTNLGLEMNMANSSLARPVYDLSAFRSHPASNADEALHLRKVGELKYNQDKMSATISWIALNPTAFTMLTLKRIMFFWFPPMNHPLKAILVAMLTVSAFFGCIRMRNSHRRAALFISSLWLSYPLVYYVLVIDNRYIYPLSWTLYLAATMSVGKVRDQVNSD